MKLIQDNPYRIAGILANSSEKELQKQKSKISRYASIGKQVDSELDFPFFENVDRSESSITKAFSRIEQNQDKVSHSLFWFLNANKFDEIAINLLISGDKEKAIEQWEKVTNGKEVNSKNFSCFNNISTLKLFSDSRDEIKEGLEAKIKLIESPSFSDFACTVADQTYTIDNQKQAERFVDDVLKQFKARYSSSDTLKLFSKCNGSTQKYLSQKLTEEPIQIIESQIESWKKKRKANRGTAYEYGFELYEDSKDDLTLLKSILGITDIKYRTIADLLANEIMQIGIDYFNESQKNNSAENYVEPSQKLIKLAESIAVGKMAKDRAKDSLEAVESAKDQDIDKAIAILRSIKIAYNKATSEIDKQILLVTRNMGYNESIDYSKVDKMKKDCLNWSKVVEVVSDGISNYDVERIQLCSNQDKLSEYKNLVDFLIGQLEFSQLNKVKYLAYWITNNFIADTQLTAKSLPSWIKWFGGIAVFMLLVGIIWGQEGIETVIYITIFLGLLFWRTLIKILIK